MRNNKGFSLVELIIVIAIMAILVGVMAPQLIKYIEKTNVSSDTQLCDTVKSAVTTAVMDPTVLNDADSKSEIDAWEGWVAVSGLSTTSAVDKAIQDTLGVDQTSIGSIDDKIKSWQQGGSGAIQFQVVSSNSVHVRIENTDNRGLKGEDGYNASEHLIYVD